LASVLLTALLVKFKIGLKPIDPALAAALQAAAAAAAGADDGAVQPLTPRLKSQRSMIYSHDGLSRKSDASVSFTWVLLDEIIRYYSLMDNTSAAADST
jgi:hypothetical protein